jgi:hypothetical protein
VVHEKGLVVIEIKVSLGQCIDTWSRRFSFYFGLGCSFCLFLLLFLGLLLLLCFFLLFFGTLGQVERLDGTLSCLEMTKRSDKAV